MKRLFLSYILVLIGSLIATVATTYFSVRAAKSENADVLAYSVREPILFRDFRTAIINLGKNVPVLYDEVQFLNRNGEKEFSTATDATTFSQWRAFLSKPLFQDEDKKVLAGTLIFSYRLFDGIWYVMVFFIFEALFLSLIFWREKRRFEKDVRTEIEKSRLAAHNTLARQVAHDIRSPVMALNSIVANSDYAAAEARELIQSVVVRINGIADNLLNSTKGSAVAPSYQGADHFSDANPLLRQIIEEKKSAHKSFGFHLELEGDENFLVPDRQDFLRIVSNLIENAVEASPAENREVYVKLSRFANEVQLSVIDFGKGFDPEVLEQIGTREITTKAAGNGLGLSFAYKKMAAWGGKVRVLSKPGVGSQVDLLFPRQV